MNRKDCYRILEIPEGSDEKEIKAAYKRLAKKWHPDINDAPNASDKFKEIQKAFETLMDGSRSGYQNPFDIFWGARDFQSRFDDLFSSFNTSNMKQRTIVRLEFGELSGEDYEKLINFIKKEGLSLGNSTIMRGYSK